MQVFKFPLNMDFLGQVTKQLSRWSKYLVLRDLKIVATSIFVIIFVNWWLITNWKDKFICGVFINTYAKLLEKAMAPHSSTLAWKIPRTEKPGGLQSMWSLRVRHDWATSLSLFTFVHWRRKWQPTPVFLPGESQGQRSLLGCHLWGHTESETTEAI